MWPTSPPVIASPVRTAPSAGIAASRKPAAPFTPFPTGRNLDMTAASQLCDGFTGGSYAPVVSEPRARCKSSVKADFCSAARVSKRKCQGPCGRSYRRTRADVLRLSPSAKKPLRPSHELKGSTISTNLQNPEIQTLLEASEEEPETSENGAFEAEALPASADALELFMNEIGRYPLLTAAEEVALAKRV